MSADRTQRLYMQVLAKIAALIKAMQREVNIYKLEV